MLEIIHGLLVFVFDKVFKPKLSRFTAQNSSYNLQNANFLKVKTVQDRRNKSYSFLEKKATKRLPYKPSQT